MASVRETVEFKSNTKEVENSLKELKRLGDSVDKSIASLRSSISNISSSSDIDKINKKLQSTYDDLKSINSIVNNKNINLGKNINIDNLNNEIRNSLNILKTFSNELNQIKRINSFDSALNEAKRLESEISKLSYDTSNIENKFNTMFRTGDFTGLREASNELNRLKNLSSELGSKLGNIRGAGVNTSTLESELGVIQSRINTVAGDANNRIRTELTSGIKSSVGSLSKILNNSIGDTLKVGKNAISSWCKFLGTSFNKTVSTWGSKIKNIFSQSDIGVNNLGGQIKGILGVTSLAKLLSEAVKYSSSMVEDQNVTDNVFKEMSEDIDDFTENSVDKFGLTALQAKKMIGVFGGMLNASNITQNASTEMSKNLTALAGDVASFYNMNVDDVYKKFQSGLSGNVSAMRTFGVNMTVANIEAYALSKGITQSYDSLNQATKTTLRYNYMLEQLAVAQGDFSRTSLSWANQTRILTNNFKQLMSILGGGLIKILYPVVSVLNQIVSSAINAANALAKMFGFSGKDLSDAFGGSGGLEFPDTTDYTDSIEDASDATKDLADETKKANENLASFDRINNLAKDDLVASNKGKGNSKGVDLSGSLIDFDSYYKNVDDLEKNNKLQKWLDDLWGMLKEHDYTGAGRKVATAINDLLSTIYFSLKGKTPEIQRNMLIFNDALTDFADGLLDTDFEIAGRDLGLGLNLISYYFNNLYDNLSNKGILDKTGKKIADFFNGLSDETDWNELGKLFTMKLRIVFDILSGFLKNAKPEQYGIDFKEFLLGAIERLFSNGGTTEIGASLAGVLNFVFQFIIGALGDGKIVNNLSDGIVETINTSIEMIDENSLKGALHALFSSLGELMIRLATEINYKDLAIKISDGINYEIENGDVKKVAEGFLKLLINSIDFLLTLIGNINWLNLASELFDALKDSIADNPDGAKKLSEAFAVLFGVNLISKVGSFGLTALGNAILDKLVLGLSGETAVSTVSGGLSTMLSGVATSGVFLGAVAGLAAIIYNTLGKSSKDFTDEFEKNSSEFQNSFAKNEEYLNRMLSKNNQLFDGKNAFDYANNLNSVTDAYNNMSESARYFIETGQESFFTEGGSSLNIMRQNAIDYANALEDAGYASDGMIQKLRDLANTDTTFTFNGAELKNEIATTIRDIQMDVQTETATLQSMTDEQINTFSSNLKVKASETASNFISSYGETISSNAAVLNDKYKLAISTPLTNMESELNSKGKSLGSSISSGTSDGIKEKSNLISSSLSNTLNNATNSSKASVTSSGSSIGKNLSAGVSSGINSNSGSIKSSLSNTLNNSVSSAGNNVSSQSSSIGSNIISGIVNGMNSQSSSLGSSIASIAQGLLEKFKTALGIHSPSRMFADLSKFIPEGISKGIDDNKSDAISSINNLSDSLMNEFNLDTIDLSKMLDISKFDELLSSLGKDALLCKDNIENALSSMNLSDLQYKFAMSPSIEQSQVSELLKQSSYNSGIESRLEVLYNKLSNFGLTKDNKNVTIDVYLDKNNKLSRYIIDTVSGNVIKTGGF